MDFAESICDTDRMPAIRAPLFVIAGESRQRRADLAEAPGLEAANEPNIMLGSYLTADHNDEVLFTGPAVMIEGILRFLQNLQ